MVFILDFILPNGGGKHWSATKDEKWHGGIKTK